MTLAFASAAAPCIPCAQRTAFVHNRMRHGVRSAARRPFRRANVFAMGERNSKSDSLESLDLDQLSQQLAPPPENGVPEKLEATSPEERVLHPGEERASMGDDATGRTDASRIGAVAVVVALAAALLQHNWVIDHRDLTMEAVFVIGYLGITLEEIMAYDKTGVALLMGVGVWTVLDVCAGATGAAGVNHLLSDQLADISQILFFLIGAMTIVEIVDAHKGFKVVTDFITTNNRRALLWTIGLLTFFTSAVLDNLTATIVVVSLLRKLVDNKKERWLYGAVAVVAANAGGAWTPIGGKCFRSTASFSSTSRAHADIVPFRARVQT